MTRLRRGSNANRATAVQADPRWLAVQLRDATADGTFYYSVRSTGVFCRPSCAARRARPEHIDFHESAEAAQSAGFRPCKRCKPNEQSVQERYAAQVTALCRLIERSDVMPSLAELGEHVGMSPFHTHRIFKASIGLTPRQYAEGHRAERVRQGLRTGGNVTETMYAAGFNSSGRFYALAENMLGMTPKAYRAGGRERIIRFAVGECSLGSVLVAATDKGVCAILLGDDPEALVHDLEARFSRAELVGADADFEDWVAQVVALVERPQLSLRLPLDIQGTSFQKRVWEALSRIPPGGTMTYTEIAEAMGQPRAVRAVATACAANPLAVAIPCHRVIRIDGSLAGYRWGIDRKRALLEREVNRNSPP